MLVILQVVLLWFSVANGATQCWRNKVTVMQQAMCQCCYEIYREPLGCSQEHILYSLKRSNDELCVNILNSYFRGYKRKNIDVDNFIDFCRIIFKPNQGNNEDMFVLSMTKLKWPHNLKEIMMEAVMEKDKINLFDENNSSVQELIMHKFEDFFLELYKRITKEKEYMVFCLTYIFECRDYFTAYFSGKKYKACTADEVNDIIGSIYDGLSKKDLIVKNLSSKAAGPKKDHGLLFYFCEKQNRKPAFKTMTEFSMEEIKSVLYHTAKYTWPILAIKKFFALPKEHLEQYIPKVYSNRYEKKKNNNWDLGDVVMLVNKGCIQLTEYSGILKYEEYLLIDQGINCYQVILEISKLASGDLHLTGRATHFLITYNFFILKHGKLFYSLLLKKQSSPQNADELRIVMKKLMEFKTSDNGKPTPFISQEMIQSSGGLGTMSLINLLMIKKHYHINDENLEKIHHRPNEIPINVQIDPSEKEINKAEQLHCTEINQNDPLCKLRNQLQYRPVYNLNKLNLQQKSWGKVVFVAIHTTSYRLIAEFIKTDQYPDELIKCINDVLSSTKLDTYCGIFKVNPYFGEFDNVDKLYPVNKK